MGGAALSTRTRASQAARGWVALGLCVATALGALAQPRASSRESDMEWAILQGKAGRYDAGLAALQPHLVRDPGAAKAWYVAGFLLKERFKAAGSPGLDVSAPAAKDRQEAVTHIQAALDLAEQGRTNVPWQGSAQSALSYLAGTYHDDVVVAVRSFDPAQHDAIVQGFETYVTTMQFLRPGFDPRGERAELHKNLARAYRQLFEASGDQGHFEGVVREYGLALELSPEDLTAWYNLAVNLYNRGVAVLKTIDHTTTFWELNEKQEVCLAYFKRALEPLEQAYLLQPTRPETLKGLMTVHHRLDHAGEFERYRDELEQTLQNGGKR